LAVRLPKTEANYSDSFVLDGFSNWQGYKDSLMLPAALNPESGFIN